MTTKEVAKLLDISREQLLVIISRYPDLRPKARKGRNYVWTEKDVNGLQVQLAIWKRNPKNNLT